MDVRLWKKRHAQARVRREYRTADEVLAEAADRPQAAPKQTIIDMRGPQVRSRRPYTPQKRIFRRNVLGRAGIFLDPKQSFLLGPWLQSPLHLLSVTTYT